MMSRNRGFLSMALGFAIWMAALSVLYGLQATGCALSWQKIGFGPLSLLRAILVGLFAATIAALSSLVLHSRRGLATAPNNGIDEFLWRASAYLTVAAIAATLWIGMALPLPSICR